MEPFTSSGHVLSAEVHSFLKAGATSLYDGTMSLPLSCLLSACAKALPAAYQLVLPVLHPATVASSAAAAITGVTIFLVLMVSPYEAPEHRGG
jgi:hypothetical protein